MTAGRGRPAHICVAPLVAGVPLVAKFLPESMSFLLARGRTEEARALADRYGVELPMPEAGRPAAAPETTRAALARFRPPVLLLAGEADLNSPPPAMAEFAGLFPSAALVVQPGAAHYRPPPRPGPSAAGVRPGVGASLDGSVDAGRATATRTRGEPPSDLGSVPPPAFR